MQRLQARHFRTLEPIELSISDRQIQSIESISATSNSDSLPIIAPGFFDIQINGYNGIWFSSPKLTIDDVAQVTRALVARGITRYFPTLITASHEALRHGFETLKQACEADSLVNKVVAGYHLEGPYISAEDGPRGAHPLQHVRPADFDEFQQLQEASGNRIRLVTLAAEAENAASFITRCRESGVVVAIGHTGATPEQIRAAVDAGAQLSTHFGNGAHGSLRRHPNYLWEQLASDRLWASVIADGWHLPASVLQCVLKCKGQDHTILTCDVSGFGGCPPGTYQEGDVPVEVLDDGRIVVAGQRQFLAGSGATTGDCVVRMSAATEITLADAVDMATANPAALLNEELPQLEPGAAASFCLFTMQDTNAEFGQAQFLPQRTFVDGQEFLI